MKYDYLVVGAGLFGAVFAHEMTKQGKHCLMIDRRKHIAGNIYSEEQEGIHVHKYGAHIFHTKQAEIWNYVNELTEMKPFIHQPIANYKGTMYNLPFNMNTFSKMWGISTPEEAQAKIAEQVKQSGITNPENLEEKAISLVGTDIYQALIQGYTEKQWGRGCDQLPAFIINRLPLRFTYDNNYFNDKYQGIPVGGYTKMIETLLEGTEVLLNTDYAKFMEEQGRVSEKTLYTGSLDALLHYEYGSLEYRSLTFQEKIVNTANHQGIAVVNYTEKDVPYTRCIEHKFFDWKDQEKTVLSYEYPADWSLGKEAYYPINNEENNEKYRRYLALFQEKHKDIILGGRLGLYQYLDMDQVIQKALDCSTLEKQG